MADRGVLDRISGRHATSLGYNENQYIAPFGGIATRLPPPPMPVSRTLRHCLTVGAFLLAVTGSGVSANDYAPVQQLMRDGRLADALQRADQYLASNPRDPQMAFLRGLIQQDSGRTADAIASFTRLTEEYPELAEPYNNLAVLYAAQGQLERARTLLESAVRAHRGYAVAHENLGDVYARLAAQSYATSQQLDASSTTLGPKLALIRQLTAASAPASALPPARAAVPATDRARPPAPAASASR